MDKDINPPTEKVCKRCGRMLPIIKFDKHPQMRDGRINVCRECKQKMEYDIKHKAKPPDVVKPLVPLDDMPPEQLLFYGRWQQQQTLQTLKGQNRKRL